MLLYFIRHGDPIYTPDSLTEFGKKQAEALSERLSSVYFDEIYCSTSKRALETAMPTCKKLNITPKMLEWADEKYTWEELTIKNNNPEKSKWVFHNRKCLEILNGKEVRSLGFDWFKHKSLKDYDFGFSMARINKETDLFLSSLGYVHDREKCGYKAIAKNDKCIALFAHQGFGLAFISSLMDIPFSCFSTRFDLGYSSYTIISFDQSGYMYKTNEDFVFPKILQLSNDSHLYKENLSTDYHNTLKI